MIWAPHITVATVIKHKGLFLLVEETAWHVTLTAYLGVYVYKAPNTITYVRHCFVGRLGRQDPTLTLDEGIIATHWLTADEIMADTFPTRSPLVAKAVKDYLSGKRLSLDCVNHHL